MPIKVSFDTALVDYRHETQDLDESRLGCQSNASNMKRMKSKYEKRINFMQKKRKCSNDVDYCQYNIKQNIVDCVIQEVIQGIIVQKLVCGMVY